MYIIEGGEVKINTKPSVLVIDDEPLNILILSQILGDEFIVLSGNGSTEGIEVAKKMLPDIILLGVLMADQNGFEVFLNLQANVKTKDIPIIFVSDEKDLQTEEQGLYLGAADYISKPFTSQIVKLRIRNQLRITSKLQLIQDLTVSDLLASTFAKKYFISVLDEELRRAARATLPLSFAIFKIDNFQAFDTLHGYEKREHMMESIFAIFSERVKRSGDKIVRWDEDEFALMMPNTSEEGATVFANAICMLIKDNAIMLDDGEAAHVTASAGIHAVIPTINDNYILEYGVEMLVSNVTEALAMALSQGSSGVFTYGELK